MITSLKNYIEILFSNQKGNADYQDLIKGLEVIERSSAKLVNSTGGVSTDEEFEEYQGYSTEILDLLKKHIPKLFKNKEFFRKVFYQERSNAA